MSQQYGIEASESVESLKAAVDRRSNDLFDQLYAMRYRPILDAVGLTVAFIAFALITGFFFTRQLGRSIESLVNAAREVSRGNLESEAPILSGDEIGTLAQAFNSMTRRAEADHGIQDIRATPC